jgi:hypothetical protein
MDGVVYAILFSLAGVLFLIGATIANRNVLWTILFGVTVFVTILFRIHPIDMNVPFCRSCSLISYEFGRSFSFCVIVMGTAAVLGQLVSLLLIYIFPRKIRTEEVS